MVSDRIFLAFLPPRYKHISRRKTGSFSNMSRHCDVVSARHKHGSIACTEQMSCWWPTSSISPIKQGALSVVNSSYISSSSVMAYQLGHIVILQGTFTTGGSASNGAAYFTIPSSIGTPFDNTGWSGAAGNQNTGIRMDIPAGSRTIYLTWNDTGTNTTYYMSWIYYTSTY